MPNKLHIRFPKQMRLQFTSKHQQTVYQRTHRGKNVKIPLLSLSPQGAGVLVSKKPWDSGCSVRTRRQAIANRSRVSICVTFLARAGTWSTLYKVSFSLITVQILAVCVMSCGRMYTGGPPKFDDARVPFLGIVSDPCWNMFLHQTSCRAEFGRSIIGL